MSTRVERGGPAGLTVRDLLYIVFRRRWVIVTFLLSTVLAAALYAVVASPTYESTAKLFVRVGRESVSVDPAAVTAKTITVAQTMQELVKSELEILNSQIVAEQVVDSIGPGNILDPPPEPKPGPPTAADRFLAGLKKARKAAQKYVKHLREEWGILLGDLTPRQLATKKLMDNLDVEGVYESNVIVITADAETRQMAQRLLDELLKFHLAKHMAVYSSSGPPAFFRAQAEGLEKAIAAKDQELQALKNESKILSIEIQQSAVAKRIAALQDSIEETETALVGPLAKIAAIGSMRDQGTSPSKRWQAQLLMKDGDELSQRNEIAMLHAKMATYQKQLAAAQEERRRLTNKEAMVAELQRELDIDQAAYKMYRDSSEQARISEVLQSEQISNISVLQPPTYPLEKVSPKGLLGVILGVIVGLLGGVGLAFLIEYLDDSVKTPEDVDRHLHLPALATIPFVKASLIRGLPPTLSPERAPLSAGRGPRGEGEAASALRRGLQELRERLRQLAESDSGSPRLVGVTSCHPREGVSTISRHLAALVAEEGPGRVLLVDANFDDAGVHQVFDLPSQPGLREVLERPEALPSAIQLTPLPRLDVLPAGGRNGDAPNFEAGAVALVVEEWKRRYDYVIVDLPSGKSPFLAGLAAHLDGALVVVETDRVRWQVVDQLKARFEEAGARLLGIALNKRRFPIPSPLYRQL